MDVFTASSGSVPGINDVFNTLNRCQKTYIEGYSNLTRYGYHDIYVVIIRHISWTIPGIGGLFQKTPWIHPCRLGCGIPAIVTSGIGPLHLLLIANSQVCWIDTLWDFLACTWTEFKIVNSSRKLGYFFTYRWTQNMKNYVSVIFNKFFKAEARELTMIEVAIRTRIETYLGCSVAVRP